MAINQQQLPAAAGGEGAAAASMLRGWPKPLFFEGDLSLG